MLTAAKEIQIVYMACICKFVYCVETVGWKSLYFEVYYCINIHTGGQLLSLLISRRRKDRHEASGFSRRPDPDSDEDEDYERERRKRSKEIA